MQADATPRPPAARQPALWCVRASVRLFGALLLIGAAVATAAAAADGVMNDGVTRSGLVSSGMLLRPTLDGGTASIVGTVTTQTMVWTGGSRLWLGLGLEQRTVAPLLPRPAGSPVSADAGLLIGLGVDAGSRARLTWQTPLLRADGGDTAGAPRQMRMGLVFSPRDPYADLRKGMLTRIELSGQTALALRSRGGRLGLTLTSQW